MKINNMNTLRFSTILVVFGFFFSIMLLPTCAINPVTGKKELSLMSTKQEIEMGKGYDPQVVAQYGLYENPEMQAFINEKGKEMAAISHRSGLTYDFKILDSPIVNAFAVPGGYVYFTRGIMAHFNNEAEFAGVLGHEIGHIAARHSARQYTKQMVAQAGFLVGVIASKEFRNYADAAQQGLGLLFLSFSRANETESDELGVEYSTKIGYDAKQMANFFNTLKRMRGDGEGPPTFLSTHPDPGNRYVKVGQLADKWQAKSPEVKYNVNRDKYLRMIDGLIYGEDPRQGYQADGKFFHPELKFEYPVPANWQLVNSPSQVQMGDKDGKAMMVLKLAQGQSIQVAADSFISENKLTLNTSQNKNINGFSTIRLEAIQPAQSDESGTTSEEIKVLSYFYQYGNLIYQILGVTKSTDYFTFSGTFENTMRNFKKLTDPARINVKPDLIKVVKVPNAGTVQNIFKSYSIPEDRYEEIAMLNSMMLTDNVPAGSLIKVLGK
jgi:predicted Zn-dependent protease